MKEVVDAFQTLNGLVGSVAALAILMLVWEKLDHSKTRKALLISLKERAEEAMKMTAVVEASKTAAEARNETTLQQTSSFQQLTQVVNLLLFQRIGPPLDGKPPQ